VGKLQGASFSSLWIISPFIFLAGIILCCLGFAIFGITEVPTDGVGFETGDFVVDGSAESLESTPSPSATAGAENVVKGGNDATDADDPELGKPNEESSDLEPSPVPSIQPVQQARSSIEEGSRQEVTEAELHDLD
jgi:hypothetical protein